MPPPFWVVIGAIVYFWLVAGTLIIFVPMLLFNQTSRLAKKVLATVLISFPCLIAVGILCTLVFLIPALIFSWLTAHEYIAKVPGIVLAIIGLIAFVGTVAISSLYLWYLLSKLIHLIIDKKPTSEFIERNKVFRFMSPLLYALRLYRE